MIPTWMRLSGALSALTLVLVACTEPGPVASPAPAQPAGAIPLDPYAYLSSRALEQLSVRLGTGTAIRPTGQTKEFHLMAKRGPWEIAPGNTIQAVTYNGTVPGPTIRAIEGDTVRVTIKNELDQDTTIHWHGLHVPNSMDGVPPFSQAPIRSGETFIYEFLASHAGTFMYHPHVNSVQQIDGGLYGLLIIDPQQPDEPRFARDFAMMLGAWNLPPGGPQARRQGPGSSVPPGSQMMPDGSGGGQHQMPGDQTMPGAQHPASPGSTGGMAGMGMGYNWFAINGKAFPATETWLVKTGDLVRVRIVNISNLAHPMHLHGHDFKVVAKDGEPLRPEMQQVMNTLTVNAGETYDIVFLANNPGTWVFHCHELHHTENDGVEPGGLIQLIRYEDAPGAAGAPAGPVDAPQRQPTPTMPSTMPGMTH